MAAALFRMIAALGRIMTLAMSFGGFAMLILFALGGFVLARGIACRLKINTMLIYFFNALTDLVLMM